MAIKDELRKSYLTRYETVKNFVENEENISKTAEISHD